MSPSSVSCTSLNHDDTGTALCGWKMYEAGELSRMIVLPIGLPSCDKSYGDMLIPIHKNGGDMNELTLT